MTTTLLFGGQGSQKVGMLHEWSVLPAVRGHVATATEILGEDAWELDTEEALHGTRAVQLSLLILQTGVAKELMNHGVQASFAAGHSLGAWSAAVTAGALSLEDALRMVDVRATGMAEAVSDGYGMAAIIGLGPSPLEGLVQQLRSADEEIWLSNLNSPAQSTVSGSVSALAKLEPIVEAAGAQRMVRLKVAVPAHSPLMQSARENLDEAMGPVKMTKPAFPLLANTTGRMIRTAPQLRADLIHATDRPVQWSTGVAALSERGIDNWIQVSPGNNLVGLLRDVKGDSPAWCTDNVGIEETATRVSR